MDCKSHTEMCVICLNLLSSAENLRVYIQVSLVENLVDFFF